MNTLGGAGEPAAKRAQIGPHDEDRLIKIDVVMALCGKSRSSIYAAIKRGEFAKPVKIGPRASAWLLSEIVAWKTQCISARDLGTEAEATVAPTRL
ncbi:helix-turn-helix transcriptional regulator [Massilia sp. PWRC2]|uniref:helix-turn-helix transcriptional regulator n=1 Tax=Massilia sp. PWRC2 TaxID=2804626 RepID=UPI003CF4096E